MTILTDEGLILLAPEQDATTYLLELQFQNFQAFVNASPENKASFAWLQAVTREEYE